MITINVIENQISGSYGDTPFSVNYSEDTYKKMMELSDRQQSVTTMDEYNALMEEFAKLTVQDYKTTVETECKWIHVNEGTGEFFLKHEGEEKRKRRKRGIFWRRRRRHTREESGSWEGRGE